MRRASAASAWAVATSLLICVRSEVEAQPVPARSPANTNTEIIFRIISPIAWTARRLTGADSSWISRVHIRRLRVRIL